MAYELASDTHYGLGVVTFGDDNVRVVWICNIVSGSKGSIFAPVRFFKVSLGDVSFSPSVYVFGGGGSQDEV